MVESLVFFLRTNTLWGVSENVPWDATVSVIRHVCLAGGGLACVAGGSLSGRKA